MDFSVLKKTRVVAEAVFIAVFLFVICAPFMFGVFWPEREAEATMRGEVSIALRFHKYADAAEAFKHYYTKNFGLRKQLVALNAAVKLHVLGMSSSASVAVGKKGYMFYLAGGEDEYARALWPLEDIQLESWRKNLEIKRDVLASRRVLYMFVICPNKESIYPEYYPRVLNRVRDENNFDQLLRHLKKTSDFRIIDLRPALLKAKRHGAVYYKTDTHWTQLGAHAGYSAIIKEMSGYYTDMRPLPLSAFGPRRATRMSGDLSNMLGLHGYMSEPDERLAAEWPAGVVVERRFKDGNDDVIVTRADGAPPVTAVIFHDSFMNGMMPFVSGHFRKTYFVHGAAYRQDIVDRVRPGVVIEEMVERLLQ